MTDDAEDIVRCVLDRYVLHTHGGGPAIVRHQVRAALFSLR